MKTKRLQSFFFIFLWTLIMIIIIIHLCNIRKWKIYYFFIYIYTYIKENAGLVLRCLCFIRHRHIDPERKYVNIFYIIILYYFQDVIIATVPPRNSPGFKVHWNVSVLMCDLSYIYSKERYLSYSLWLPESGDG